MNFASLLKRKRRKFDISVIWWILLPYASLFLCFTLFMNYMLQVSSNKLQEEMYSAHSSTFSAITANIESLKQGCDSFALQVSNDNRHIALAEAYQWDDADIYYKLNTLKKDLETTLFPGNSITAIGIYYPNSDNLVFNGGILDATREFKNYYFSTHMPGEKNYNDWKTFMLSLHNFELYQSDSGEVFYIHSILQNKRIIATVILDINEEVFRNILNKDLENSGIVIYNHLNEVIYFSGTVADKKPFENFTPDFNKPTQTVETADTSYIQFNHNKTSRLKFSYYIEETEFYKSAKNLTTYFYRLIVIFILLTLVILLYLTKSHYRSVSNIMKALKKFHLSSSQSGNTKNEYAYIMNSVQTLSHKLIENEITINKQNRVSLMTMLKKHLTDYYNTMDLSKLLDIYHVNFTFKNYIAALITINYADENCWLLSRGDDELIFTAVGNLFIDYSTNDYQNILVQLDETTAFMLIGTDVNAEENITGAAEKFFVEEKNFCSANLNFDFYVHISDVFADIGDTKSVYEKLRSAHYINPENAITFQSDIPKSHSYDYGFLDSSESALMNSLEEADFNGAKKILENLFTDYLNSVPSSLLSYTNIRLLNAFSSLAKSLDEVKAQDYINLISRVNPQSATCKDHISLAEHYCNCVSAGKSTNLSLAVAVTEYVNSHFTDCTMNVNTLSYEFGKTPSYVSSLFKAETGKMLNQYISETRLQHAKLLLLSDKNVDKIASECGFSDITTFRRTFKRYVGITPSEYRKNYKK